MSDFASWLAKRSSTDPMTKALQDFANANADKWPLGSNSIEDYQKVVAATASGAQRDDLLTALGRLYERWSQQHGGFLEGLSAYVGQAALFIGGLIIAVGLVWGIFINRSFFDLMAQPDHARGLITFLFSFATIAIIVLVAVAIFWMEKDEVEARFAHAKDVITILVGVLGTVLGFYFGTASTGSAPRPSVAAVMVTPDSAIGGDKVRVSTQVSGGIAPYQYDVIFESSSGTFDATKMNVAGRSSPKGDVSEEISVPAQVPARLELMARVVVRDSSGARGDGSAARLTISPSPAVAPANGAPAADNK
jgi:hypothetical protein